MTLKRSDETYVVFFRPLRWDMATDELAASLEKLDGIIESACHSYDEGSTRPQSSVFGRFLLVPRHVEPALHLALKVVTEAAKAGVELAAGVTCGIVIETADFVGTNYAGNPINMAARLSSLTLDPAIRDRSPIRVDTTSAQDASQATTAYRFSGPWTQPGKRTTLTFRCLQATFPPIGPAPAVNASHQSETGYVVVYDVVRYSEELPDVMAGLMEALRRHVRNALPNIRDPNSAGIWYGPAGDGGAIVFRAESALHVLRFAMDLLTYANAPHSTTAVRLRVGISRGQFVVIGNNLPVGSGINDANDLASLALEGSACISGSFWSAIQAVHQDDWRVQPAGGTMGAYHVYRSSGPAPSAPVPLPPGHACRLLAGGVEGTCAVVGTEGRFALTARALTYSGGSPARELTVFAPDGSQLRAEIHQDIEKYSISVLRLESSPPSVKPLSLPEVSPSPNLAVSEFQVSRPAPAPPLRARNVLAPRGPSLFQDTWQQRISLSPAQTLGSPSDGGLAGPVAALDARELTALIGSPVLAPDGAAALGIVIECPVAKPNGGAPEPAGIPASDAEAVFVPVAAFRHLLDLAAPVAGLQCLVVLSEVDGRAKRNQQLAATVRSAVRELNKARKKGGLPLLIELPPIQGAEAIASLGAFSAAVRDLCRADVVVFDITRYEPAVMMLAGIRAVVRRGVTILSSADESPADESPGAWLEKLPFNIKDANLVSHSTKSHEKLGDKRPEARLGKRIEYGLDQRSSQDYLDLPAYDAVRNLPPGERSTIGPEEAVLALVPFNKDYEEHNWYQTVYRALVNLQSDPLRGTDATKNIGVVRSLDLDSPRLISHAIYGYIRRVALCVFDWTGWRPNVFFELGVRIAAGEGRTVCLIQEGNRAACLDLSSAADSHPAKDLAAAEAAKQWVNRCELTDTSKAAAVQEAADRLQVVARQAVRLFELFPYLEYPRNADDELFKPVFEGIDPASPGAGTIPIIREVVAAFIDPDAEVPVPVHRELLASAMRYRPNRTEGVAATLFPENPRVERLVADSIRWRMLAAWRALMSAYNMDQIIKQETLRDECNDLIEYLTAKGNRDHPSIKLDIALNKEIRECKKMLNAASRSDASGRREAM